MISQRMLVPVAVRAPAAWPGLARRRRFNCQRRAVRVRRPVWPVTRWQAAGGQRPHSPRRWRWARWGVENPCRVLEVIAVRASRAGDRVVDLGRFPV